MLFDEPTSALDPEMVGEVLEVIQRAGTGRHDHGASSPTRWALPARWQADVMFIDEGVIMEEAGPGGVLRQTPRIRA